MTLPAPFCKAQSAGETSTYQTHAFPGAVFRPTRKTADTWTTSPSPDSQTVLTGNRKKKRPRTGKKSCLRQEVWRKSVVETTYMSKNER